MLNVDTELNTDVCKKFYICGLEMMRSALTDDTLNDIVNSLCVSAKLSAEECGKRNDLTTALDYQKLSDVAIWQ